MKKFLREREMKFDSLDIECQMTFLIYVFLNNITFEYFQFLDDNFSYVIF